MLVDDGRSAARSWVAGHAAARPDFRGAFFTGSAAAAPATAELARTSDVDVTVVLAAADVPPKPGKLRSGGALLDVTYLSLHALADPDEVAGNYYLAPSFRTDQVIADPTGQLGILRERIAATFDASEQVLRRCANVFGMLQSRLHELDAAAPWHELITAWMFPTSLTTQVVLTAARRPPTVRRRYLDAREVLTRHGDPETYQALLWQLGCADCDRGTVQRHLETLAGSFDDAAAVARTPFFFSSDITAEARAVSIDGSQELIDAGNHREAVFWIVATFARCQQILVADASADVRERGAARFGAAVRDLLGLGAPGDLRARRDQLNSFLPALQHTAEKLVAATG